MRRPARVLVSGQVAASASDREFPASTERSGTQRGTSPAVVHLGALVLVVTGRCNPQINGLPTQDTSVVTGTALRGYGPFGHYVSHLLRYTGTHIPGV
jgi:hypothetical protein